MKIKNRLFKTAAAITMFSIAASGIMFAKISHQTQKDDEGNSIPGVISNGSGGSSGKPSSGSSGSGTSSGGKPSNGSGSSSGKPSGGSSGSGTNSGAKPSTGSSGNSSGTKPTTPGNSSTDGNTSHEGSSGKEGNSSGHSQSSSSSEKEKKDTPIKLERELNSTGKEDLTGKEKQSVTDSNANVLIDKLIKNNDLIGTEEEKTLAEVKSHPVIKNQKRAYSENTAGCIIKRKSIAESGNASEERSKAENEAGDPVYIATGFYHIYVEDSEIKYGTEYFPVSRNFVTQSCQGINFGSSWSSSVDTRIIHGSSKFYEDNERKINSLINSISKLKPLNDDIPRATRAFNLRQKNRIKKLNDLKKKNEVMLKKAKDTDAHNIYSMTSEYSFMSYAGFDKLLHIDVNGNTMIFQFDSEKNIYIPEEKYGESEFIYISVEKVNDSEHLIVHYPDDTSFEYDEYGLPVCLKDKFGSKVEFVYQPENKKHLLSLRVSGKDVISFQYAGDFISSIKNLLDGSVKKYIYDENRLLKCIDEYGNVYSYEYDDSGDVTKIIKPDSSFINVKYGETNGRKYAKEIVNEAGGIQKYIPDDTNKSSILIDEDGFTTKYTYNDKYEVTSKECNGLKSWWTYNSDGFIDSYKDDFDEIHYYYDEFGNVIQCNYGNVNNNVVDDEKWTFINGKILSTYKNRLNVETVYSHDDAGNITSASVKNKKIFNASYNTNGLLKTFSGMGVENNFTYQGFEILSDGNRFYQYENGNLISITREDGRKVDFTYSKKDRKNTETCKDYYRLTQVFDCRQNVTEKILEDYLAHDVMIMNIKYDKRCLPVSISCGKGKSESEARKNMILLEEYFYTAAGKVSSVIKWNHDKAVSNDCNGIQYQYFWKGRDLIETDVSFIDSNKKINGKKIKCSVTNIVKDKTIQKKIIYDDGVEKVSVKKVFDVNGNLLCKEAADGSTEKYFFDVLGRVTENVNESGGKNYFTYDDFTGKILNVKKNNKLYEEYSYDNDGNISREVLNGNQIFTYGYKKNGSDVIVTKSSSGKSSGSTLGLANYKSSFTLDKNGLIKKSVSSFGNWNSSMSVKDENGKVTYDINGERFYVNFDCYGRKIYDSRNNHHYEYDVCGNLSREWSEDGFDCSYQWNALGKISCRKSSDGNEENWFYNPCGLLMKKYDSCGLVWSCERDLYGNVKKESGRLIPERTYEYDLRGRIVSVVEDGKVIRKFKYGFNENSIKVSDAKGKEITYVKDQFNNLKSVTNRIGKNKLITEKSFSTSDIKDFNNNIVSYSYDSVSRKIYINGNDYIVLNPDGTIGSMKNKDVEQTYVFIGNARLSSELTNGRKVDFTFDDEGRRLGISGSLGNISYTYDRRNVKKITSAAFNASFNYDSAGREVMRKNDDGSIEFTVYDYASRVIAQWVSFDNNVLWAKAYVYDANGRVVWTCDEKGRASHYCYDAHGRITSIVKPFALDYCSNPHSSETETLSSLGISADDRKTLLNHYKLFAGNTVSLAEKFLCIKESYVFDINGNLSSLKNMEEEVSFTYDAEDRLVSRVSSKTGRTEYQYDDNGNLILEKSAGCKKTFCYNNLDRMISCTKSNYDSGLSETTEYSYDMLGRLSIVKENEKSTVFIYDGLTDKVLECIVQNNAAEELSDYRYVNASAYSSSSSTLKNRIRNVNTDRGSSDDSAYVSPEKRENKSGSIRFVYANDRPVYMENGTDCYSVFTDERGNIILLKNLLSGNVIHFEYGNDGTCFCLMPGEKNYSAAKDCGFKFTWCGLFNDCTSGFYCNGFRWYSPDMRRFTTCDPYKDGFNWYSYCNGDWINFSDKNGFTTLPAAIRRKMQEVPQEKLGNSETETVNEAGCYITLEAGVENAINGTEKTATDLNREKSYFDDASFDGNSYLQSKNIKTTSYTGATTIKDKISECFSSTAEYVLGVKTTLKFRNGIEEPHFVGITGDVVNIDGVDYVRVVPTSINDVKSKRVDWKINDSDGQLYIPINKIESLRVYERDCSK